MGIQTQVGDTYGLRGSRGQSRVAVRVASAPTVGGARKLRMLADSFEHVQLSSDRVRGSVETRSAMKV